MLFPFAVNDAVLGATEDNTGDGTELQPLKQTNLSVEF